MQLKYLIIGYFFSIIPAIFASYFEAFIDNDPNKINFINIILVNFTIFFPICIIYVITRYRFMDIRVVLKKTVVHFVSFSLLILIIASLILSANKYLLQNYNSVNIAVIEVMLVVVFLPILKKMVLNVINKYFEADEIDLSKNIEEFNKNISYSNYLDDLTNQTISFIKKELSVEKVDFIVRDFTIPELGYFFPLANKKLLDKKSQDIFLDYFSNNKNILLKQEIPYLNKENNRNINNISHYLNKEKFGAIISLKQTDVINGFILLGAKKDEEIYSQEDVELLKNLADQVNVALFRVLSYEEAVARVRREFKR